MDMGAVVLEIGDVVQIQISGLPGPPCTAEVVDFDSCEERHPRLKVLGDTGWDILGDGDYVLKGLLYKKKRGP